MARRYGDPVEVKARGGEGGSAPGAPDSFLWRGRLYVVRSVLGHWRERRAWWNESAARALHGEVDRPATDQAATDQAVGGIGSADAGEVGVEREVWRVEASAGRHVGVGVYDLCQSPLSRWSLLRVAD